MADRPRQHNLLLILARSFAEQLAMAVTLIDAQGRNVYYNEAAAQLLGRPFIEGAQMPPEEWSTVYRPRDDDGTPLALESLPLGVTMLKHEPSHQIVTITGGDGVDRRIQITAFPLFAHTEDFVGAIAVFWEFPLDRR